MYGRNIWIKAERHGVDFLTQEETSEEGVIIARAPYMSKSFIQDVERNKPASVYIKYLYTKGLISWLAWVLRVRRARLRGTYNADS